MSERIVITIHPGAGSSPKIEHQTRDIAGRGYDTIRTTTVPSRFCELLRGIVREADKDEAVKARDEERKRLEARLAAIDALDKADGRNQVPGMPSAICHACGLGVECNRDNCPNKGKNVPSFGSPLGAA